MALGLPKIFPPSFGLEDFEKFPFCDLERNKGLIRSALVVVKKTSEVVDGKTVEKREVSLKHDYCNVSPLDVFIPAAAQDLNSVVAKWNDVRAKGGDGFDGVCKEMVKGESDLEYPLLHFWDNPTNNQCDVSNKIVADFPFPLTEPQALWLAVATGLNLKDEACWTTPEFTLGGSERKFYRFGFNLNQIPIYLKRMEGFYNASTQADSLVSFVEYKHLKKGMKMLEPPSHLDKIFYVFTGVGIASTLVLSGGVYVFRYWRKILEKSGPGAAVALAFSVGSAIFLSVQESKAAPACKTCFPKNTRESLGNVVLDAAANFVSGFLGGKEAY